MKNSYDEILEYYAFMRLADNDLLAARRSLDSLKRVKHPDSVCAIIRDSLISYARPFTANRGIVKKRNLRLMESVVPDSLKESHKKVMEIRDQVVAHTDVCFRKPMVGEIKGKSSRLYPISYKAFFYDDILRLPTLLEPLITKVGKNLWNEIHKYELEYL